MISVPAIEVVTAFVTRGGELLAALATVPGLAEAWHNVAGGA
jgi:hypothetical protein